MPVTNTAPEGWAVPYIEILGGYPSEAALEVIENWPYDKAKELIEALRDAWYYPDSFRETEVPGVYRVATGGWSGHEDIIGAMKANTMIWMQCYMANATGGLYIFGTGFACYGGATDQADVDIEVKPRDRVVQGETK